MPDEGIQRARKIGSWEDRKAPSQFLHSERQCRYSDANRAANGRWLLFVHRKAGYRTCASRPLHSAGRPLVQPSEHRKGSLGRRRPADHSRPPADSVLIDDTALRQSIACPLRMVRGSTDINRDYLFSGPPAMTQGLGLVHLVISDRLTSFLV